MNNNTIFWLIRFGFTLMLGIVLVVCCLENRIWYERNYDSALSMSNFVLLILGIFGCWIIGCEIERVLSCIVFVFLFSVYSNNRLLALIGLTIFEQIFEARARYFFIYAPFYILLASAGIMNLKNIVTGRGDHSL